METVLADASEGDVEVELDESRVVIADIRRQLRGGRAVSEAIAYTAPGRRKPWPLESIRTGGGPAVRHAFELAEARSGPTPDFSLLRFRLTKPLVNRVHLRS